MSSPRLVVEVARHAGFCSGVREAVETARKTLGRGRPVFLFGPLVHNPEVERELGGLGARTISDLNELPPVAGAGEPGKESAARPILVIPSHGAPPDIYRRASALGYEIVDATCPLVRRLQQKASQSVSEGLDTVIVGDPSHTEVRGALGHAHEARAPAPSQVDSAPSASFGGGAEGGGRVFVVRNAGEAKALGLSGLVTVVAQTTQRAETVREVVEALAEGGAQIRTVDTLCAVTSQRQQEAHELARRCDVILVLGGRNSANTQQLASIAREEGIPTHHIESTSELEQNWFSGKARVGLLAGASTPASSIEEVRVKMSAIDEKEEKEQQQRENTTEQEQENAPAAQEAAPAPEPQESQAAGEEEDMASAMKDLKPGEIVRGKVVSVDDNQVLVDVGYKSEGVIPASDFGRDSADLKQLVQVGDEIDVYVKRIDSQEGNLILSKRRADEEVGWKRAKEAFDKGEVLTAPVVSEVKGGLIVNVGLRGFLPASHVDRGFVKELAKFVGQEVRVKVIELDRAKNQVILSRKIAIEEEAKSKRDVTWADLSEGQVRHGVVKRLTDFGAFVDLGGVDGLLHVSELSWGRVNHPSEVLKEGQEIDVIVLRLDREKDRISLGYKQIQPDPWSKAAESYREGSIIEGKVVRLAPFGAFIELEPGIDGLVHISQLADRRVEKPADVVTVGETVKAKVLSVNPKDHRISLSIREASDTPREERSAPAAGGRRRREPREREPMMQTTESEESRVTLGDVFGSILAESKKAAVEAEKQNGRLKAAEKDAGKDADKDADEKPSAEPEGEPDKGE